MYKIIIVEDDHDIRHSIIETIDWQEQGYKLIGQAGNGHEALELLEKYDVDVIITDIKMPFMNGIELAKAIRNVNPITKLIFISGYNEFDYAISAIKFNVIEYLLKPVSKKELLECLWATKEKLDAERHKMIDQSILRKSYEDNIPAMRIMFLYSLITRNTDEQNRNKKIKHYHLNLLGESNVIFTISVDKNSITSKIKDFDPELVITSVIGLVQTIASKYVSYEYFIYNENVVVILSDTQKNINDYANVLIDELHKSIKRYYGFSVTIGVSQVFDDLGKAPDAYADSISAIHYRLTVGSDKIIYSTDFEDTSKQNYLLNETMEINFIAIIRAGADWELKAFLSEIFNKLKSSNASLAAYQVCIVDLYSILIKILKNSAEDVDINVGNSLSFISNLYKWEEVSDIQSWFENICLKVIEYIAIKRQSTVDIIGSKAMTYILENYADPDLSLKKVSDALHLSSNYLSSVFKKSVGQPFTDALIKIRMEKAKELLYSTGLKIFEIAEKTGYSDQHYFSYCFKKHYGLSPLETRNASNEKKSV